VASDSTEYRTCSSGIVDNTTDYDLWSTGFAHQGGALAANSGSQTPATGVEPVPEPAAIILGALGAAGITILPRPHGLATQFGFLAMSGRKQFE
jgi:hypothetical protein